MGSERLLLRVAASLLIIGVLGLPINDLGSYGLLVAAVLVVFTGTLSVAPRRWFTATAIAVTVLAIHVAWPTPRIAEGHNVFLPGPRVAETSGLPADVLRVLEEQFDREYPPEKRCDDPRRGCWRPDRTAQADGFAFSADAVLDRSADSRHVGTIAFSDPAYLRLGFINDHVYGWPDDESDVKRFERDRHSLNLFDRYRVTFPLFVVYRFPAPFVGSTLCWRGTVLWERDGARFEMLDAAETRCREIAPTDVGRSIFGVSIRRDMRLAMSLAPNASVQMRRIFAMVLAAAGVVAIILLLVRIDRRRLALPALLVAAALAVTTLIEAQLIGGLRPFDSGDDGIAYEGFGRAIVQSLLAGDFAGAARGVEPVYHFTPGLRYMRALELMLFGETSLLYLSAILLLPVLVFALCRRFLPARWALVLALAFAATPVGAVAGSSLFQYVMWAARGYADPFAFTLLLAAMLLVIPPPGGEQSTGRLFAAGLLFAAATFCRPNLLLASAVMIAGTVILAATARQWRRAAAVLAGFAALIVAPLHNYAFGHVFVLFSDIVGDQMRMSPLDYVLALGELARLDVAGAHLKAGLLQLGGWLSGPEGLLVTAPLHAFAVALLAWVGLFGRSHDPWLRIVALAALLQHGIGASYTTFARYSLGTWLLTALVAAAWLERDGLALLCGRFPGLCRAWQKNALVGPLARMIGTWSMALGLEGTATGQRECPKTGIIRQSLTVS